MSQEIADFEFFRDHRMIAVDFNTGRIDTHNTNRWGQERIVIDVGSINQDGYVRIRIGKALRMKHRYLFWLYHGYLPDEVDHGDKIRNNNSISNLKPATRSTNTKDKTPRKYSKLTEDTVHELCQRINDGETNITKLAKLYGRSRTQIKAILDKKYWSHISDQYFQEGSETIEKHLRMNRVEQAASAVEVRSTRNGDDIVRSTWKHVALWGHISAVS